MKVIHLSHIDVLFTDIYRWLPLGVLYLLE